MSSNNEAPREFYPGFSDDAIRNFLFQRQFYQPDGSQQQLPQQQHEIQAPTTPAGREQEVELSGSLDNENTNEEEENSFVANSLLMLQQAQNNSISTTQTNSKSPEDELDIELFIDLVRQFRVIWNTRLNGFKDYNKKKVVWNNISSSLDNKYSGESMFSLANAMLFNCRYTSYSQLDSICLVDNFPVCSVNSIIEFVAEGAKF